MLTSLLVATALSEAAAQQTIFNDPSPDVLGHGVVYLESDWYARPWDSGDGSAGTGAIQPV